MKTLHFYLIVIGILAVTSIGCLSAFVDPPMKGLNRYPAPTMGPEMN